jgi:hypothetical protein
MPTCFLPCFADMRRDVQEIFRLTPHEKQCMMFSATLSKEIRPVCRKFMQDVSRVTPRPTHPRWPRPQHSSCGPPRAGAAPRQSHGPQDAGRLAALPSFPCLGHLGASGVHTCARAELASSFWWRIVS